MLALGLVHSLEGANMSQAKCPSCGFGFDNQRRPEKELRGRLLYGPERLIGRRRLDAEAFDMCPKCGTRFESAEFQFFGEFARAKLHSMAGVYALVMLVVVAFVISIWLSGR
jgi:hypothetical protein